MHRRNIKSFLICFSVSCVHCLWVVVCLLLYVYAFNISTQMTYSHVLPWTIHMFAVFCLVSMTMVQKGAHSMLYHSIHSENLLCIVHTDCIITTAIIINYNNKNNNNNNSTPHHSTSHTHTYYNITTKMPGHQASFLTQRFSWISVNEFLCRLRLSLSVSRMHDTWLYMWW